MNARNETGSQLQIIVLTLSSRALKHTLGTALTALQKQFLAPLSMIQDSNHTRHPTYIESTLLFLQCIEWDFEVYI